MITGGLDDPGGNGPRLLLAEHHDELECICVDIEVGLRIDDPLDLVQRYRAFSEAVEDHLAAEESEILPAYETYDPRDASVIREQHAAMRNQLFAIGIEVELHAVRAATLRQILETLRAHSLHEDRGMYPWAQVHLPRPVRFRLFQRIGQSIYSLRRVRRAFSGRPAQVCAPTSDELNE